MAPAENNIIEVLQKASPSSQEHEENPNKWWMWNPNSKKEDDEKEKEKEKEEEESWEVKAFAEDTRNNMTCTWPPRSYTCTFCRREFRSAQALGGHMNVHRRDRARLHHPNINAASRLCLLLPNFSSTPPISTHHHYPPNYFHSFPSPTTLPNHYSTTKFHLPSPHQDLDLELRL